MALLFREPVRLEEWIALDAALVADVSAEPDAEGGDDGDDGDAADALNAFALDSSADGQSENDDFDDQDSADLFRPMAVIIPAPPVTPENSGGLDPFLTHEFNISGQPGFSIGNLLNMVNVEGTPITYGLVDPGSGYWLTDPVTQGQFVSLYTSLFQLFSLSSNGDDISGNFEVVLGGVTDSSLLGALQSAISVTAIVNGPYPQSGSPSFNLWQTSITLQFSDNFSQLVAQAGGSVAITLRYTDTNASNYGHYFDFASVTLNTDTVANNNSDGDTDDGPGDEGEQSIIIGRDDLDPPSFWGGYGSDDGDDDFVSFLFSLGEEEEEEEWSSEYAYSTQDLDLLLESEDLNPEVLAVLDGSHAALNRLREQIANLRNRIEECESVQLDENATKELGELLQFAEGKVGELGRGIASLMGAAQNFLGLDASQRDGVIIEMLASSSEHVSDLSGQSDAIAGAFEVLSGYVGAACGVGANADGSAGGEPLTAEGIAEAYAAVEGDKLAEWRAALGRKDNYTAESAVAGIKQGKSE